MRHIFIIGHGSMNQDLAHEYNSSITWYGPETYTVSPTLIQGYADPDHGQWTSEEGIVFPNNIQSDYEYFLTHQSEFKAKTQREYISNYINSDNFQEDGTCYFFYHTQGAQQAYTLASIQEYIREHFATEYEQLTFHWLACRATSQEDLNRRALKYNLPDGVFIDEASTLTQAVNVVVVEIDETRVNLEQLR